MRTATFRYIGNDDRDNTMFIVWGKTVKRQKLGFVADYCHVCHDLRTFKVERVGLASHVYYISFGQGELQGYERTCGQCASGFETRPDDYHGMSRQERPAQELLGETFPNYYSRYREQIELDKKVRDTPSLLTPAERHARLWQPFAIKAQQIQPKLATLQMDWQVGVAFLSIIPILWVFETIAEAVRPEDAAEDPRWLLAALFLSVGIVGWTLIGCGRRYALRHAAPPLANALATLRPSETELAGILAELKSHKLKLGSKLVPADVLARIEELRRIA